MTWSNSSPPEPQLRLFADLLRTYGARLGLLGPRELDDVWERHVRDSLRGLDCLEPDDELLVDLGSGAGLPGVPIAAASPTRRVVLLEPNERRVAFLEMAVERLELHNASVLAGRTDTVSLKADVCLARAFAPPLRAWEQASRLLKDRGRLIYYAGRSWNHSMEQDLERAEALPRICQDARFAWQGPIVSVSRRPRAS
ncbi:MAG TPA: 16S rRNA (guanine(527)-N(7))-methyltransferase RsmG [Actinomycetota bacterium]|nr:16S rRNA (guanine(527)-N(7))-methyltransferase RsmG [Actinomycetota bacterium]